MPQEQFLLSQMPNWFPSLQVLPVLPPPQAGRSSPWCGLARSTRRRICPSFFKVPFSGWFERGKRSSFFRGNHMGHPTSQEEDLNFEGEAAASRESPPCFGGSRPCALRRLRRPQLPQPGRAGRGAARGPRGAAAPRGSRRRAERSRREAP